jgi:DNA helicase-2/ATP-dependent DNA helicase PcrA
MATDILEGLNPQQREAVETVDGPLLIIAGPGSGKTRVITHRIAYLIQECGVSPRRVAAVTFTNKAAREMRHRLAGLLGAGVRDLFAGTFHSFCAMILRRDGTSVGVDPNFVIYDDSDQIELIKLSMKEVEVDPKRFGTRAVLSRISGAKSRLMTPAGFASQGQDYFDEIVLRVYERYDQLLAKASALDFDDLLLKTFLLLQQTPEVAAKYQERYVHLLIDEFQDTNTSQYQIARLLSDRYRNLCVVGDPDQSIYSWRNADIRNILSFQTDYPEAKTIALEENYRSTETILGAAEGLIATNTERVQKELWTSNDRGVPIVISEGYDEREEAQLVIKEIQNLTESEGYALGDIAVMYRVNAQSRALEEACLRYGVRYQIVGGMKFYHRQEVKDLVGYLRLIVNPNDDVSLARVVNVPPRGVGQRTLDELRRLARDSETSLLSALDIAATGESPFGPRQTRALADFRALIEGLQQEVGKRDLVALIDIVLERTGYGRYLQEEPERGEERWDNIREFQKSARDYLMLGVEDALTAFLENVSLVSDVDSFEDKAELTTLITLHQAKGLEFPVVFIVGMEEGLLPHIRSMDDPAQLEEERRLCYVGVTRAKDRLYLFRAFRRGFRGGSEPSLPSRFLSDIPRKLVVAAERPASRGMASQGWSSGSVRRTSPVVAGRVAEPAAATFKTGDKVRHTAFGQGVVVSCTPSGGDFEVTVAFKDRQGVKRLLLSFAPLEKVE